MDAELKQKWITALRSGDYQQASGQLRNQHAEFCCLGVLAQISGACVWDDAGDAFVNGVRASMEDEYYLFPEFASLDLETQKHLATMNDNGRTFAEIADWVEKNVPSLAQDERG